ncbi:pyridoxal-phosphate dependent enzyme [Nocardioides daeguensis]|uniref:Pyridoxal-phosphate dependent enzyme n=1 Tax=Nocardioides daeguensis TaxID=908359 RepID=A0ABP6V335_9ACTN|nr:pyridoxal-phosphate dependent enzyme [Nocardioides daeguensis]MBV6727202.1 pyridoxal-phosphate dependent enzyme [Nocardioides daeguensis]MCR1771216.1 pyridoxal-phosphate dependent enzyme [Nocardioides daeguensis]
MLELSDVVAAQERIAGAAHRTPVLTSRTLDEMTGARLFLKCESLQRTGSFKFRGAYNLIASLSEAERRSGVCAVSAGNHGQAVALAARLAGTRATILMPGDAPEVKLAAVAEYGADIVTYDRFTTQQTEAGREWAAEHGSVLVHPFDDPRVAAGAGTVALEMLDELGALDVVLVPIGGGGAISGIGSVLKQLTPRTRIIGVEPAALPITRMSMDAGERVRAELRPHLADGQMLTTPGEWTFPVMCEVVDDLAAVTDAELLASMALLLDRLKLATEPSGAAALAAALSPSLDLAGARVGVLVSGGNVGAVRLADLLSQGRAASGSPVPAARP